MVSRAALAVLLVIVALVSSQGSQNLRPLQEQPTADSTASPEVRVPLDFLMMRGGGSTALSFGFQLLEDIRNIRVECDIVQRQEELRFSKKMNDLLQYRKQVEDLLPKSDFSDLADANRDDIENNFDDKFEEIEIERERKLRDLQTQCKARIDSLLAGRKREALTYAESLMRRDAAQFAQLLFDITGYSQQLKNGLAGCIGYYRAVGENETDGGMEDPRELCYEAEINILVEFIREVVKESNKRARNYYGDDEDYDNSGMAGSGDDEEEERPSVPNGPPPEVPPTVPSERTTATTNGISPTADKKLDPVKEPETKGTTTSPTQKAAAVHTPRPHRPHLRPRPHTEGYPEWADEAFNTVRLHQYANPRPQPPEIQQITIQRPTTEPHTTSEPTNPPSSSIPRPSIGPPLDIHVMTPLTTEEEPTTGSVPRPSIGPPVSVRVMTPLTEEEEPTTDSIPRPTVGRPVHVHVDTPEKPTPGGKMGSPERPTTPRTATAQVVVTEEQYYNYGNENSEVGVEVNVVAEESTDSTATVEIIDTTQPEEIIIDPLEEDDSGYAIYIVTYTFATIGGVLVIIIFFLIVAILVVRHQRNKKCNPPLLSEEQKIAVMKQSGYVNPTYKFFDQTAES